MRIPVLSDLKKCRLNQRAVTVAFRGATFAICLSCALMILFEFVSRAYAQTTATISWNITYQIIDGFGVSDHALTKSLNSSQADLLFSPSRGIGLSILRTGTPEDGSCVNVSVACAHGGDLTGDMTLAQARGAAIFATAWTPPASMKTNKSIKCMDGLGSGALSSSSYRAFATYLSNYIASLAKYDSVAVSAISPSNEPDQCQPYDSAIWSAQNLHDFIRNDLGPTLAANGQTSTLIVMPETSIYSMLSTFASTCMNDPSCSAYVGVDAFHGYDNLASIANPYRKKFWQTEVSDGDGFGPSLCGGCWDPSIADAMMWANIIDHNIAVANESAWLWWWWYDRKDDNEGLINGSTVSIRTYVMGNYAKFVRPGWVRIDATHEPQTKVMVSAYKNPHSGDFAIIATNQNKHAIRQEFTLSGFAAMTVTPWITAASQKLQSKAPVPAGSSFTYTLPGRSVVTFVGSTNAQIQ